MEHPKRVAITLATHLVDHFFVPKKPNFFEDFGDFFLGGGQKFKTGSKWAEVVV